VAAPDLGIKRICPSCAAKFYDLSNRPIVCPKCTFSFSPEALVKMRRPRTGGAASREDREESLVKAAKTLDEVEDTEDGEAKPKGDDEDEGAEEEIKEVALDDETTPDPDLVAEEDAGDAETKPEVVGDEVDLEAIEEEDEADDEDDVTLIETVDEDEGVADIIDKDNLDKE